MSIIFNRISEHLNSQLPFVVYRAPNSKMLSSYFLSTQELHYLEDYSKKGFLFAPFDNRENTVFFPREKAEIIVEEEVEFDVLEESGFEEDDLNQKEQHKELIRKGIDFIRQTDCQKVVLSRKEVHEIEGVNSVELFKSLLSHYSKAFVYLWYHPSVGLWLGATPETLVSVKGEQFKTIALASTQEYQGAVEVSWGEKELQEHQFVTDFITETLRDLESQTIIKEFNVSERYTVKAGNLLHLRADIEGNVHQNNLKELIHALHPTPAVCGLPKEMAKDFILRNELYNRSFYTGFLGELNVDSCTNLYVNLRCAELQENDISFYVGGGVTVDSIPEKEWLETVAKTRTIKKAIK